MSRVHGAEDVRLSHRGTVVPGGELTRQSPSMQTSNNVRLLRGDVIVIYVNISEIFFELL